MAEDEIDRWSKNVAEQQLPYVEGKTKAEVDAEREELAALYAARRREVTDAL